MTRQVNVPTFPSQVVTGRAVFDVAVPDEPKRFQDVKRAVDVDRLIIGNRFRTC